jgi:signal transduction histidine kinase
MIVIYSSQNDEAVITLEKTNVGELVEAVCEKYKDVFEVNHILLHQSYEDDCQARLNRRYISQAVDNYITNSIKHSSENDSIYVRVMKNADYIRIEVENQGPAIPSEYQEKVWEMFFKGDVTETLNGQKGSGLGLYLVKSIVELHQGNCGFKNLEKGIVFWIEIPKE